MKKDYHFVNYYITGEVASCGSYRASMPGTTYHLNGISTNIVLQGTTNVDIGCLGTFSDYHYQDDVYSGFMFIFGGEWDEWVLRFNLHACGMFTAGSNVFRTASYHNYAEFVGCRTDYHSCTDNYIWNGFGGDWRWSPSGIAGAFSTNDYGPQYITVLLGCRDLRTGYHWVMHGTSSYTTYFIGPHWADPIDYAGTFQTCDYIGSAYEYRWGCHVALRTEGIIIGR